MFSINAARSPCASETTDAAFRIPSVFLVLESSTPYPCVCLFRRSLDEGGIVVKMGSFVR